MTLWEHLAELRSRHHQVRHRHRHRRRRRLVRLSGPLLDFLQRPVLRPHERPDCDLIATGPLDAFTLRIQMSVYVGIALAMPVLLWQLWRFITPGLYPNEKKLRPAVRRVGAAAVPPRRGHRLPHPEPGAAVPRSASAAASITPLYTAQSYLKLIVFMMLAFGLGFEFPVLLVALAARRRRHARGSSAAGGATPSSSSWSSPP